MLDKSESTSTEMSKDNKRLLSHEKQSDEYGDFEEDHMEVKKTGSVSFDNIADFFNY